jgi:hypothetical protein
MVYQSLRAFYTVFKPEDYLRGPELVAELTMKFCRVDCVFTLSHLPADHKESVRKVGVSFQILTG